MYLNLKCFEKLNAFALLRMNMTIAHDVNYIKSFHSGLQKTEQYDISWVFMRSTCVVVSLLQILKILNRQLTIEINSMVHWPEEQASNEALTINKNMEEGILHSFTGFNYFQLWNVYVHVFFYREGKSLCIYK